MNLDSFIDGTKYFMYIGRRALKRSFLNEFDILNVNNRKYNLDNFIDGTKYLYCFNTFSRCI